MSYDVVITDAPAQLRAMAAQVLEDTLGLEPAPARELAAAFPSAVIARTSAAHAEIAAEQLRDAGFTVEIIDRTHTAAPRPPPAPAPGATDAVSPTGAEPPRLSAQRRMFDTRAIRSLERELEQVDLEALAPTALSSSQSFGVLDFDAGPAGTPATQAASPTVATSAQTPLAETDPLFYSSPSRARTLPGPPRPHTRGAMDELDDLFQAPGPRGAEAYFARKTQDGRAATRATRRQGTSRASATSTTHGAYRADGDSVPSPESISATKHRDRSTLAIGTLALVLAGLLVAAAVAGRWFHF